eukprot:TRINITY_DN4752_c0_g1_i1.p1 TRINITY_DN4752_c0_g1~~TRINITY_DN4752_c0_g1_i1.p1  ORF type:complete len:351 (-),score=79.94 TRINITY_DN4752_c0_g1_i1:65-1096(-)
MKIFFKRPPEAQKLLGAALAAGLADPHQDVHDRALLYYRLLRQGVETAERVVNPPKQAVSVFADRQTGEIKDRIFDEFNSLAVVYHEPSYMFLDKEHRGALGYSEDTGPIAVGPAPSHEELPIQSVDASDNDLLLSAAEKEEDNRNVGNGSYMFPSLDSFASATRSQSPSLPSAPSKSLPSPADTATFSMISASPSPNLDDLLGLGDLTLSSAPPAPQFKLEVKPVLDPPTFKRKWGQLPLAQSLDIPLSPQAGALLTGPQAILRHMQAHSIQCMASGGQAPKLKFFFFAQTEGAPAGSGSFLVEFQINSPLSSTAKVKADDTNLTSAFVEHFRSALRKFGNL